MDSDVVAAIAAEVDDEYFAVLVYSRMRARKNPEFNNHCESDAAGMLVYRLESNMVPSA